MTIKFKGATGEDMDIAGHSSDFGMAGHTCPCGCGERWLMLSVEPNNPDAKALALPLEDVPTFIAAIETALARITHGGLQ